MFRIYLGPKFGIYKGFIRKCFRTNGILSQRGAVRVLCSLSPGKTLEWGQWAESPWACAPHPVSSFF